MNKADDFENQVEIGSRSLRIQSDRGYAQLITVGFLIGHVECS